MKERRLWAIILAGGEGSRLVETTRRIYGTCLPKQFLTFGQARTFLQTTVDRLQGLIEPKNTVCVVAARHEEVARKQLAEFPGVEFVAQPRNAGTGPGVLLPLVHVLARDSSADVALVPSDHDFRAPEAMRLALLRAKRTTDTTSSGMVLLGARAEYPASDLGWIVPKRLREKNGVRRIDAFVEKPAPSLAEKLFEQGALWNTMLSVARAESIWRLGVRHLPTQAASLARYAPFARSARAADELRQAYEGMLAADFSRDLVTPAVGLRVTAMTDSGWSDCGTPERLAAAFGDRPGPSQTVAPVWVAADVRA